MIDRPPDTPRGEQGGRVTSGTVTFLFTDIEGSTRLWEGDPVATGIAVAEHDRLLRNAVASAGGEVVKGMGDGILAAFSSAVDALLAAVSIQRELQTKSSLKARMAVHTGEVEMRDSDFFGAAVNRCSRVLSAAHGSQVLVTRATNEVLPRPLPDEIGLADLGHHRLRDLADPMHLFQVTHPALPSEFPPLRGTDSFEHNLPAELTAFIGRETEMAEAARAIESSRMLTLTGVGGAGKSRLGVAIAHGLLDRFPSGVWLVPLSFVTDPGLVDRSIAQAVGVPEEPGRSLRDSVTTRLLQAPALLVMDNCEHLVAACADSIHHLLRAVPDLKVLATSRERIGVPGEAVYVVPPMSVPAEAESLDPSQAMEHDAVVLFVDRAELADPGFVLDAELAPHVGRVCRLVDGIPLAIELAASRVAALSVEEIASRLESRLEIGAGARVGDRRHETMLATLDWSYDLLEPAERALLGELAVFRGAFSLADAEAVCDTPVGAEVIDVITALFDKSLVTRDLTGARYRLLEPVRRYARDRAGEQGLVDDVDRRHAHYFADLAEELAAASQGADHGAALDRMEREHDNLRAALRWVLDHGEGDVALGIAGAAWPFWKLRGHLTEGRRWLTEALDTEAAVAPSVLLGALSGAGDLAGGQGDHEEAERHLERARDLAEQLGDDMTAAENLARLAGIAHRRGDLRQATRLLQEGFRRGRQADDPSRAGLILSSLALLYEDQGMTDAADGYAVEMAAMRQSSDDPYVVTSMLLAEGEIAINRGDWGAAEAVLDEALEAGREAGFADVIAWATAYLGKLHLGRGDAGGADDLLSRSLAMFQGLGMPAGSTWAMRHLGRSALGSGDVDRADALLREALRISLVGVRPDAPLALEALAEVKADKGEWDSAAVLAAAFEAAREVMGISLPAREAASAEAARQAVIAEVGQARFDELWAIGASMTMEEAAAYAGG